MTIQVSVIIPTKNRFDKLLFAIKSIQDSIQTIPYEIIIIDDCSDEDKYTTHDWSAMNVIYHRLKEASSVCCNFPCSGYVRNIGVSMAKGKYIAFCDDDDQWYKGKLEMQITAMEKTGCEMSVTDGRVGIGPYNKKQRYPQFLTQHYYGAVQKKFHRAGSNILVKGFPLIWDKSFLTIHNCVICSSAVIKKSLYLSIGGMGLIKQGQGVDYDCWLRALDHTNIAFVSKPLVYYDLTNTLRVDK